METSIKCIKYSLFLFNLLFAVSLRCIMIYGKRSARLAL